MDFKVTNKSDADKAIKILAKTVYRNLQAGGYSKKEIVSFTTEVIGLLASGMREEAA